MVWGSDKQSGAYERLEGGDLFTITMIVYPVPLNPEIGVLNLLTESYCFRIKSGHENIRSLTLRDLSQVLGQG